MNKFDEIMLMRLLKLKYANMDLVDMVLHDEDTQPEQFEIKNVCARMPKPLVDQIESVCAVVSISKTRLINDAVAAYVDRFWDIENEHQVLESIGAYKND